MDCVSLPHTRKHTIPPAQYLHTHSFSLFALPKIKICHPTSGCECTQRLKPECQRTPFPDMFRGSHGYLKARTIIFLSTLPQIFLPMHNSYATADATATHGTHFHHGARMEGDDNEGLMNFSDMVMAILEQDHICLVFLDENPKYK